MDYTVDFKDWSSFFKEFSKVNFQRTTRIEILDAYGIHVEQTGMPLTGIDVDLKGTSAPSIEIMLGGEESDRRRLSHTVHHVHQVRVKAGPDGRRAVLDIESDGETKTLLFLQEYPQLLA